MNRILLFCALGALWGCRQAAELSGEAITLSCSPSESAKVGALTAGDEVAVFARLDGTETYFLEAAKFTTGSDGKTLTATPAIYYPEPKQAVNFYAYVPYHTGTFSVPTDQSTAAALKQADLCWATTKSTPISMVPLTFEHQMARLVVQTNKPTEKIACRVVPSGTLNAATGQFTLSSTQSEVSTTGSELIVPVQPLTRLVLTVSAIEYVFEGSITLQAGQTTTLNLTLHPNTQTATLNGSSTTPWTTSATQGNATQAVSNILTLHWPNYEPKGAAPTQVTLTIDGTDYAVSSGITYANKTFTVPFASVVLTYPYTISNIAFLGVPQHARQLVGATIYKSGGQTVGINDKIGNPINPPLPSDYVKIGSLYWAKGNLVATSNVASGNNGCKVGSQYDGGLYFQFGSLIGWKGGALANGGTGVGSNPYIKNYTYWGEATSWSWANDAMVWPTSMTKSPSEWPNNIGFDVGDRNTLVDQWFFSYNIEPYSTVLQDIRGFAVAFPGDAGSGNLATGRYAVWGIGDACTYYLGSNWRLPTAAEYKTLFDNVSGGTAWASVPNWNWTKSPYNGALRSSNTLYLPASGLRYYDNGYFSDVAKVGYYWSSSVSDPARGSSVLFYEGGVTPQYNSYGRSFSRSVRCVSEAP